METKSSTERFLLIQANARVQSYSDSSEVIIFHRHHVERLLQDKRSGSSLIEILDSQPDPCREDSTLSLVLDNFTPSYIFRRLATELNDCNLSRHIRDYIFEESQRPDLPQGRPLLITVSVDSTRREYSEREETCAICLGDFESKPMSVFPGCFHQFHGKCIREWIVRSGHSCPICRRPFRKLGF